MEAGDIGVPTDAEQLMSDNPEPLISPALYQQTLERLDLQSICLDRIEAFCDREGFDQSGMTLHLSTEADDTQDATHYSICIGYVLEGRQNEDACLRIKATYRLVFIATEPVPAGFFDVFQELNLRMLTLPYFRELVSSLTGRMELPTLVIPLNIFPSDSEEDAPPKEKVKQPRKRATKASAGKQGA